MKALKPWRSFDDQLEQLQERGLQVTNKDAALDYLQRVGYYSLSGYWYPMRSIDKSASETESNVIRLGTFVPDSRFEDVARLYVFDKKLRLLALDALERIEMAVRVNIAYLLGQRDPLAHEKAAHLHGNFAKKQIKKGPDKGKTQHEIWLEKYRTLLNRARKEPFVLHHQQKYGGSVPIWAAIEVWDFGLLSRFFAGMKHEDQQKIAVIYNAPNGKSTDFYS